MARHRDLHFTAADVTPMIQGSTRLRDLSDGFDIHVFARALAESMNELGAHYAANVTRVMKTMIIPSRETISEVTNDALQGRYSSDSSDRLEAAYARIEVGMQTILSPIDALGIAPPPPYRDHADVSDADSRPSSYPDPPDGSRIPRDPDGYPIDHRPIFEETARPVKDEVMPVDRFLADDSHARRESAEQSEQNSPPLRPIDHARRDPNAELAPGERSWLRDLFQQLEVYHNTDVIMRAAFDSAPPHVQSALFRTALTLHSQGQTRLFIDALQQHRSRPFLEAFFPEYGARRHGGSIANPPGTVRPDPVQTLLDTMRNDHGFRQETIDSLERGIIGLRPRDEGLADIDSFDNAERVFNTLSQPEQQLVLDMLNTLVARRAANNPNSERHQQGIGSWQWMFGLTRGDSTPGRPASTEAARNHWQAELKDAGYTDAQIAAVTGPFLRITDSAQQRGSEIRAEFDAFLLDPANVSIPGFVDTLARAPSTFRALTYQTPGQLRHLYGRYREIAVSRMGIDPNSSFAAFETARAAHNQAEAAKRAANPNYRPNPINPFGTWLENSRRGYGLSLKGDRGEMQGFFEISISGAILLKGDKDVNDPGTDQVAFWPETGCLAVVDNKAVIDNVGGASALQQNLVQNLRADAAELAGHAERIRSHSDDLAAQGHQELAQQLQHASERLLRGADAIAALQPQRSSIELQALGMQQLNLTNELTVTLSASLLKPPAERAAAFADARANLPKSYDSGTITSVLDGIAADLASDPQSVTSLSIRTALGPAIGTTIFDPYLANIQTLGHGGAGRALRSAHPTAFMDEAIMQVSTSFERAVTGALDQPDIRIDRVITNGFASTNQLTERAERSGLIMIDVNDLTARQPQP